MIKLTIQVSKYKPFDEWTPEMHVDLVTVSGHMHTEVQTITCDADV